MLRGWLSSKKAALVPGSSSPSVDVVTESRDLEEAMKAANLIFDDDFEGAEKGIAQGNSSFHKLGKGLIQFIQASLGFEAEVMREAAEALADAEAAAAADMYKAQKDPNAHRSSIYQPGAEFALCNAMAQLMGAVMAVFRESLTDSVRGVYKLRRAYTTLEGIIASENAYTSNHPRSGAVTPRSRTAPGTPIKTTFLTVNGTQVARTAPSTPTKSKLSASPTSLAEHVNEDEVDEFYDADEAHEESPALRGYSGTVELDGVVKHLEGAALSPSSTMSVDSNTWASYFSSSKTAVAETEIGLQDLEAPVDIFIHSGANLCYGLLQLVLSLVPPAFGKILSVVGFRGDRRRGLRMIWQASRFHNAMGAMSGLLLLTHYNALVGACDIIPMEDPSLPPDAPENLEGYPSARLEALLAQMRSRFPRSKLWQIESARQMAARSNLSGSSAILKGDFESPLRQVTALAVFERSLQAMYMHDYKLCEKSFRECVELNNWSHALYCYTAGAAHVELYRRATDMATSDMHKQKAGELLLLSREKTGKRRIMAKQLPFDAFVIRKLNKWETRAKEWNVSLVDAIGVSPIEEMIYFWNGHKRMSPNHLKDSLKALAWSEGMGNGTWSKEGPDEHAMLAVLRAVVMRNQGRYDEAIALLKAEVLNHDRVELKGGLKDDWTCPTAHYEMACNLWASMKQPNPSKGDEGDSMAELKRKAQEAEEWLDKVAKWESYSLDARIGLRVAKGLDTVRKWRTKNDS